MARSVTAPRRIGTGRREAGLGEQLELAVGAHDTASTAARTSAPCRTSACCGPSIATARGVTVLLVEQNANMALSVADRGYVLEAGTLLLSGKPEELWNNDHVRVAYLGGLAAAS